MAALPVVERVEVLPEAPQVAALEAHSRQEAEAAAVPPGWAQKTGEAQTLPAAEEARLAPEAAVRWALEAVARRAREGDLRKAAAAVVAPPQLEPQIRQGPVEGWVNSCFPCA